MEGGERRGWGKCRGGAALCSTPTLPPEGRDLTLPRQLWGPALGEGELQRDAITLKEAGKTPDGLGGITMGTHQGLQFRFNPKTRP